MKNNMKGNRLLDMDFHDNYKKKKKDMDFHDT